MKTIPAITDESAPAPLKARVARAVYTRVRFPFRAAFSLLAHLRSSRNPARLAIEGGDDYLVGHVENYFKEQWLYGYPRVYDLLTHFQPPADPSSLKVLSIGPRTEIELYYLCALFGFAWENVIGADVVSPTPKIVLGDMSIGLPFPDGSFDVIVASHCLEKSRDPERTRDEILRVARPGARVLVCGNRPPAGASLEELARRRRPYPLRIFENGVYGLISLYGLDLGDIEYMNARSAHGFQIIFRVDK